MTASISNDEAIQRIEKTLKKVLVILRQLHDRMVMVDLSLGDLAEGLEARPRPKPRKVRGK